MSSAIAMKKRKSRSRPAVPRIIGVSIDFVAAVEGDGLNLLKLRRRNAIAGPIIMNGTDQPVALPFKHDRSAQHIGRVRNRIQIQCAGKA